VFVLSTGEPTNRHSTKIGGLPYLKRDQPWPTDNVGDPIPFLAQFNFSESQDIVGNVDGDILLVFGHAKPSLGFVLQWTSLSESANLVNEDDIPIPSKVPTFFGTRWRTVNYPDWKITRSDCGSGSVQLDDGRYLNDLYFAYELLAMQISQSGFIPPGGIELNRGEKIICSLSGIAVSTGCPYPLLNQPEPADEVSARRWLVPMSDIEDVDGFGVLFIVRNSSGNYRCAHKNL
jgi:hypothetical protein